MAADADYCGCCGCCGHEITDEAMWCHLCESHVGLVGHLWNRTYFARTGRDCPYQAMPALPSREAMDEYRSNLADLAAAERKAAQMSTHIVIGGRP